MTEHYTHGEVIRATIDGAPVLFHYGLVSDPGDGRLVVYHNPRCCGPTVEPLVDFFKGRTFAESLGVRTNATHQELMHRHLTIANRSYDLAHFNCEDYVNTMTGTTRVQGGKFMFWAALAAALFIIWYTLTLLAA